MGVPVCAPGEPPEALEAASDAAFCAATFEDVLAADNAVDLADEPAPSPLQPAHADSISAVDTTRINSILMERPLDDAQKLRNPTLRKAYPRHRSIDFVMDLTTMPVHRSTGIPDHGSSPLHVGRMQDDYAS